MQRFKKFIIVLTAVLMILSVPLAAAEMSVRWEWALDDPDVTMYRYQIGGEDPDGWTVLPQDTDSLEISGLDADSEYTLYLQRSYDGINWSPSATSTAKADVSQISDVRLYRYGGYELRAEIMNGSAMLYYPETVSEQDAVDFIAYESEKYGLADSGITYSIKGAGIAEFGYPDGISRDTAASELDVFVNDLVDYITAPKAIVQEPEPVAEPIAEEPAEPAVVREYEYAGYKLTATISSGKAELVYPSFITDDDVNTFFAVENAKYGLADLGVSYAFGGAGEVAISYPEAYSNEEAAAELDVLVEDLIAYLTPAPEPVVEEAAEEAVEPAVVREYEYAGYKLTATISSGKAELVYPSFITDDDVNTFFAVENAKYGLADLGVSYAFGGAGEVAISYPEAYSNEEAAAELDVLVEDLIAYLTPAAEPVAEDSAIVREYEYAGYKLTATISSGKAELVYPSFITDDEVNTFFAIENAKYGLADLGVSYAFGGAGEVTISYPEAYSNEEAAAELDVLVEDLIAYLTPAPEPVVEEAAEEAVEPAVVREYEYAGYKLTATISSGKAELVYPSFITDDEVNTFFAIENAKYGLADLGVSYAFGGAGEVAISYPEAYSNEEAAAELDVLVEDLIAYLTPAPEPVVEEAVEEPAEPQPVLPIAPLAPVEIPEEEDSPFAFSLLVRGGVASSFDTSFSFSDTIFAEAGLGFDFSRILPIGDHFGFGLRSDLLVDFVPKANGKWDLEDNLQYFNVFNYAEMTSIDLKLTMDIVAGPVDIYVGGGAGFAIGNPHDNSVISEYLQLGTFNIGSVRFSMDWFASAIAGIRFYIGDVFSIGAEVNYRYMVESNKHMGSADLVLGFTF